MMKSLLADKTVFLYQLFSLLTLLIIIGSSMLAYDCSIEGEEITEQQASAWQTITIDNQKISHLTNIYQAMNQIRINLDKVLQVDQNQQIALFKEIPAEQMQNYLQRRLA